MLKYLQFVIVFCSLSAVNASKKLSCDFHDVSEPIDSILCAIEKGIWSISVKAPAVQNVGCLLGANRCQAVMAVPTEQEVPQSPPPPNAKNKQYQELAMKAEKIVPSTWWRQGFANDVLLLSHNDSELPRKQFDAKSLSNKKLKNINQCVTKQQFIRKSFDFNAVQDGTLCPAMTEQVVLVFMELWKKQKDTLGGEWVATDSNAPLIWFPHTADDGKLLVSALEVSEHFFQTYGGIWTGCMKLEKSAECRGALAAAVLVICTNVIADIAGKQKTFTESQFVRGYLLASLGRGLLHGDSGGTGNIPLTSWGVRLADFVALQGAYLRLYIDTFGAEYTKQLNTYIPLAFPPSFDVQSKPQWRHLSQSVEPIYTSLRNWMFTESANLIDFGPYRPLVAFEEVRQHVLSPVQKQTAGSAAGSPRRRVLIDVGANGFFASPKYLIDSYAAYVPFTHLIMVEPEPHFSATVPKCYSDRYNITFLQIYAEVATGSDTDMLRLLPRLVTKDDFVVLKFDVDPNRFAYGPTMEWGFLFSIMQNPDIAQLVDEVYIELHFHFPSLYWKHYHSNWEALDAMRYLRSKGVIVHSWP